MDQTQAVVDETRLQQSEIAFRARLEKEPDDVNARLSLAWCLFLQALHQAGRESVVCALVARTDETKLEEDALRSLLDINAHTLLSESLRQAAAVRHLSSRPQDSTDVSRLRDLASLSGASKVVAEAEQEAGLLLTDLLSEMIDRKPAHFLPGESF